MSSSRPRSAARSTLLRRLTQRLFVVGGLAVFIAGVYVAVVVGIARLVGAEGKPNRALAVVATLVVVIAFERVRGSLERLARRLVYGERMTPYEALAEFSERVAATYASDDALPRMARVVAEGTGASRTDVWVRFGSVLSPAASWPPDADPLESVGLTGDALPAIDADRAIPIRHTGELLGAITIRKGSGEEITGTEDRLLSDLASQAGLVLRNVRLTAELAARVDEIAARAHELRESRQRIVAAQEAARRRLERDIHDGAQQHLVALAVQLGLASTIAQSDPEQARVMVQGLREVASEALETLRDLARGIHPPLLTERGVVEALRAQAGKTGLAVEVDGDARARYAPGIEAAVYFTCLEALQNAAKHSQVAEARVSLRSSGDELVFEIADDGAGFDPATVARNSGLQNMADRVAAFGGHLVIDAAPGRGTRIVGRMPAAVLQGASV